MGRSLIFPDKKIVSVALANDEKTALRNFAKTKGMKVSTFVRSFILAAVKNAQKN